MTLIKLQIAIVKAEKAMQNELARLYPVGMKIRVRAQSNHIQPTEVTVIDHPGGRTADLSVRWASGHATKVPYTAIVK